MIQLTADLAKHYLLIGDIQALEFHRPFGTSLTDCVNAAIDVAHTHELDKIGTNIGITRRGGYTDAWGLLTPGESDGEFRERLKRYSDSIEKNFVKVVNTTVDSLTITLPNAAPRLCQHQWKTYVGLSQTFDYCVTCDVKRNT